MIATASDGTRLHYTVSGEGPPLLLVGGKTSTIAGAWWRYIPALATQLRVIAFDNRGSGASDKPDLPYSTALMAEDAMAVLLAAGEPSAHCFGISLGGMVLQRLALDHPDAVRSLVLAATHCGNAGRADPTATPPAPSGSALGRYANLYEPSFILDHADWVSEDARHFGKMPLYAIHRQDQAVRNHDTCGRLAEIRQPVLILHGLNDRMVPVERAKQLAAGLPNAELVILDPGGHQVHSEQFDAILGLVLRFVQRVEAARSR